jgi:hypothetical protein
VLGILRWRSGSIVPGMVMHGLNNALIGTLAQRPELAARIGLNAASGSLQWSPVLVGTVLMLTAIWVLMRMPPPESPAARTAPAPAAGMVGPADATG